MTVIGNGHQQCLLPITIVGNMDIIKYRLPMTVMGNEFMLVTDDELVT
jgi:hypothetical protein